MTALINGVEYFNAGDEREAVEALSDPKWNGQLLPFRDAILEGESWETALDNAVGFISAGCGVTG